MGSFACLGQPNIPEYATWRLNPCIPSAPSGRRSRDLGVSCISNDISTTLYRMSYRSDVTVIRYRQTVCLRGESNAGPIANYVIQSECSNQLSYGGKEQDTINIWLNHKLLGVSFCVNLSIPQVRIELTVFRLQPSG